MFSCNLTTVRDRGGPACHGLLELPRKPRWNLVQPNGLVHSLIALFRMWLDEHSLVLDTGTRFDYTHLANYSRVDSLPLARSTTMERATGCSRAET